MTPTVHTRRPSHPTTTVRLAAWTRLLPVLVLTGLISQAPAQVEPVEPVWMTVTRDIEMRCGDLTTFYKVADLNRGQVVRMDARSTRWARIIYPVGQHAFVAAADADVISDTQLRLRSNTARVRAPNVISGIPGSWRSLYLGDVKPGTVFEIMGKVEAREGQVIGYRVKPPHPPAVDHPPYGYVELAALRQSTPPEIEAHLTALRPVEPDPAEPKPAPPHATPDPDADRPPVTESPEPEPQPAPEPKPEPRPEPAPEPTPQPQPRADAPDTSLLDDMVLPGAEPTPEPAPESRPAEATPPPETTPTPQPSSETARDWLTWPELEAELSRVRARGGEAVDDSLEELIAEYDRTLARAETEPMRRAINSRLEWLRLRKATRDERLALDAALEQAQQLRTQTGRRIREWQSSRGYDIVGRLVPSSVYDGTRLPRMYRVRAAEESGLVRTVGYLRDVPALELESKVGQIVGVIGESRLDRALHLRIITPVRIDTLEASREPVD